jgi:hypothetical protein
MTKKESAYSIIKQNGECLNIYCKNCIIGENNCAQYCNGIKFKHIVIKRLNYIKNIKLKLIKKLIEEKK